MKNTIQPTGPDAGTGNGSGVKSPEEMMAEAIRLAAAAGPRYGDGSTYGSGARYYLAEGETAPPLGDKVKLMLARRSDLDLVALCQDHIAKMAGNTYFPSPVPSAPDFLAVLTAFQNGLAACESAKNALKATTAMKDQLRVDLELELNQRADYVQSASNGNGPIILTSGFDVRNAPTPVGPLPPPINIRVELNGVPGLMKFRWENVLGARGYLVECSEDVQPRVWSQIKNTSKASLFLENMEVGKIYVFRFASQGGSTGQSPWSAEVIRGAA